MVVTVVNFVLAQKVRYSFPYRSTSSGRSVGRFLAKKRYSFPYRSSDRSVGRSVGRSGFTAMSKEAHIFWHRQTETLGFARN